jgi:hypothetical protein
MSNLLVSLNKWATDYLNTYKADSNKSLGMFSNTKGQGGSEYSMILLVAAAIVAVVALVIIPIVRSRSGEIDSHWYSP